jgi:hypothetical protein
MMITPLVDGLLIDNSFFTLTLTAAQLGRGGHAPAVLYSPFVDGDFDCIGVHSCLYKAVCTG